MADRLMELVSDSLFGGSRESGRLPGGGWPQRLVKSGETSSSRKVNCLSSVGCWTTGHSAGILMGTPRSAP